MSESAANCKDFLLHIYFLDESQKATNVHQFSENNLKNKLKNSKNCFTHYFLYFKMIEL